MDGEKNLSEILLRFEETMIEAGRRLFDINLLLDGVMADILGALEGNIVEISADFPHYGADGHRVYHSLRIFINEESGKITIVTEEGTDIPWEELGVSVKDFIANTVVLGLISDAKYESSRH